MPGREMREQMALRLRGREVRTVGGARFELREVGGRLRLTGHASVTEHPYDMGWYTETIKRGAFLQTLAQNPDVHLLVDHQGLPLARTRAGNLRLAEDDRGLAVDADLDPVDPDVARLVPKVGRGDISEMSFAFAGAVSEWDDEYTRRDIVSLDIHRGDVSIVRFGANDATSFALEGVARSRARRALARPGTRDLDHFRARQWVLNAKGRGHAQAARARRPKGSR